MPNKQYVSGRAFEYETMSAYREHGYDVVRASGSHGKYDVIAFQPDRPVEFVQCKRVSTEAQANRLLKAFKEQTRGSKYFHQTLSVKVKGTKNPITATV